MRKTAYGRKTTGDYFIDLAIRALLGPLQLLPYRWGLWLTGKFCSGILGSTAGLNRRIRKNLAYVRPELSETAIKHICQEACDSFGRVTHESLNAKSFNEHAGHAKMSGPGVNDLQQALNSGRPVIFISGHFGNYQVIRVSLEKMGHNVAAIYRPLNNGYTNLRYLDRLNQVSKPNFSRGLKGTRKALRHIKSGGKILLLIDQFAHGGEDLDFMGKPSKTMVSAADFALKYDALLVPCFGIRQPDGYHFDLLIEQPIPHSDSKTMIQSFNNTLERVVWEHPGQWFWIHQRWKDTLPN